MPDVWKTLVGRELPASTIVVRGWSGCAWPPHPAAVWGVVTGWEPSGASEPGPGAVLVPCEDEEDAERMAGPLGGTAVFGEPA